MFFTFKAKKNFIKLKQVFVKALIFNYFDFDHNISIEIDTSSYIISGIFSQLTSNNLD